jgi:membrane protease YdiL (CAAX protease family)
MEYALPYDTRRAGSTWPWLALFGRTALFIVLQSVFAIGYYLSGTAAAWDAAAAWWPAGVVITNGICLAALIALFQAEGRQFWEVFTIRREHVKGDLLALLGILIIAGPIGYLPNVLLAGRLFSDPQEALGLLVRPLPMWVVYASLVLFPLTQGLAETPVYFSFAMPRLEAQGLRPWQAVALPALLLGLQHFAVPLLFDLRFMAWRALMFLPFALLLGIVLHWRPRLLPYIAGVHMLMDLSFAMMFFGVAY